MAKKYINHQTPSQKIYIVEDYNLQKKHLSQLVFSKLENLKMRNQQLSLKEIKRKGFQNQTKNLEFRGKEITVDIKNWNFLSEGLSTKHICQLLKGKKKKSSIILLEVETKLADLYGEGRG